MAKLRKAGAETRHLLAALVGDVGLVRVDLPQQQIHVHEGFVELLFQNF